jgi:hypothetical protein
MTTSGTPSRFISTAWGWRSWCEANRRRTPAARAASRSWTRIPDGEQGQPRVGPAQHAEQRADRQPVTDPEPRVELPPGPTVHPDLSPFAALATTHQHGAAGPVEIAFLEGEGFADPQPCTPKARQSRRAT